MMQDVHVTVNPEFPLQERHSSRRRS